ncbi:hypothetical protein ACROYT_G014673 [Oculina patagonica]
MNPDPDSSDVEAVQVVKDTDNDKQPKRKTRRKAGELSGWHLAIKKLEKEEDELWPCPLPPPCGWVVKEMRRVPYASLSQHPERPVLQKQHRAELTQEKAKGLDEAINLDNPPSNCRQRVSSDYEMRPSVANSGTTESDTPKYGQEPMYGVGAETTSDKETDDVSKLSLPLVAMRQWVHQCRQHDIFEQFYYLKQGLNALKKSNATEGIGATEQQNALKPQCHTKPLEFCTHQVQQAIDKAESIFSTSSVMKNVDVWQRKYAVSILTIFQSIFNDVEVQLSISSSEDFTVDQSTDEQMELCNEQSFTELLDQSKWDVE